jgi:GDPmannose 4,6-dehydratase
VTTALITGITGQDGHYLAGRLQELGYDIVGVSRQAPPVASKRFELARDRLEFAQWTDNDAGTFRDLLRRYAPSEIYNLAAMSSGRGMFDDAAYIGEMNGQRVAVMLDAIRDELPAARFCQASSSEVFAGTMESPQSETTPYCPRSPYGAAKCFADFLVRIYRRRYGLFACSAILYNHESPRRTADFVTRKVVQAAARISLGQQQGLELGDLNAQRDWGFAGDYVEAMRLMLRADDPDDFVVSSGVTHSVEDLCRLAFVRVGLDYRDHVTSKPDNRRDQEVALLVGDNAKVRATLAWRPRLDFEDLIAMMVDAEIDSLERAAAAPRGNR